MGRLIDADEFKAVNGMKDDCADCDKELRGKSKACEFDRVYTKMDFCRWLNDAPTVDAVEVVRCRECRWCNMGECEHKFGLLVSNDENYCSYGERDVDI